MGKSVESYLDEVSYGIDEDYVPSLFALELVTFIKLVNGEAGEENTTPTAHYKMIDSFISGEDTVNMCFRGFSKTTVMEYLVLYIGVHGEMPGLGRVFLGMYISDTIENGVKNFRKNLEFRRENSDFLLHYIPNARFTDIRWEFTNIDGNTFIVKGYGATTGIRGVKEMGKRPTLAIIDDLLSDDDARSPTIIAAIEDTIYKAVEYALHPKKKKIIWSGTPFDAKDPLYKAVESGAWNVNVFPICEKFPCTREEFKGAWEDRFGYDYVKAQYDKAVKTGKVNTFNQELMLRIMSSEDRLVSPSDIVWYSRNDLLQSRGKFNFYITTDFATSEKAKADNSVISVWAYDNVGSWYWVDGICKRQLMDKNIDELFRFVQIYKPQQVGIEVSGQQGGFIQWLQSEMMTRNIYFTLASDSNSSNPGIRPTTNKLVRFNTVLPMFKLHKMKFPKELKQEPEMVECMEEIHLISPSGIKSRHDDFIDTISMLSSLTPWKPSEEVYNEEGNSMWEFEDRDTGNSRLGSYIA